MPGHEPGLPVSIRKSASITFFFKPPEFIKLACAA
jgi:hypothetical protein